MSLIIQYGSNRGRVFAVCHSDNQATINFITNNLTCTVTLSFLIMIKPPYVYFLLSYCLSVLLLPRSPIFAMYSAQKKLFKCEVIEKRRKEKRNTQQRNTIKVNKAYIYITDYSLLDSSIFYLPDSAAIAAISRAEFTNFKLKSIWLQTHLNYFSLILILSCSITFKSYTVLFYSFFNFACQAYGKPSLNFICSSRIQLFYLYYLILHFQTLTSSHPQI